MTPSMTMETLETHEILQKLIQLKKLNITELARQVNLPQPTVQRIAAGTYKQPQNRTLLPIATFFGISLEQLKGLEPIPFLQDGKNTIQKLPLLSAEQANNWPSVSDNISEYVICDIKISDKAFAMYMPDASMEPLIQKGSILLIDPDKTPHHKSFILVKINNYPEPIVRQVITDAKQVFIKALSPDLNSFQMNVLEKANDIILGVVVQVRLNCEL